jgi:hypothetical protein
MKNKQTKIKPNKVVKTRRKIEKIKTEITEWRFHAKCD